jgi:hypothetical protein
VPSLIAGVRRRRCRRRPAAGHASADSGLRMNAVRASAARQRRI